MCAAIESVGRSQARWGEGEEGVGKQDENGSGEERETSSQEDLPRGKTRPQKFCLNSHNLHLSSLHSTSLHSSPTMKPRSRDKEGYEDHKENEDHAPESDHEEDPSSQPTDDSLTD